MRNFKYHLDGKLKYAGTITHGFLCGGRAPEYGVWSGMKNRCHNHKTKSYPDYGGRGIIVCDTWRESFISFISDMGTRPSSKHSIDRINNDGNYCPENCKWSTREEQVKNKRNCIYLTVDGITAPLIVWAQKHGISSRVIRKRIKRGWSAEDCVKTPCLKNQYLKSIKSLTT